MLRSLDKVEALSGLSRRILSRIERSCLWMTYPAEAVVLSFQDPSNDVFFVVKGQVRALYYSGNGSQVSFRDLGEGTMFGELSAVDSEPRSACVETLETTLIARMPNDVFWGLVDKEPAFRRAVMVHLAKLVRALSERIVEFSTLTVKSRLQAELLRLALEQPVQGGRAFIRRPPTHTDLANRIATTREAVTREMQHLYKSGLIERQGSSWLVNDVNQLYRLVREAAGR